MVYMNHDLNSNYRNADASGDEKMKNDILMSEVARLIFKSPKRVLEHLTATGFKVNGMPSSNRLSEIVAAAIKTSPKFTGLIASDIASGATFSATGCGPGMVQNYFGTCVPAKRGSRPMAADGQVDPKQLDPKAVADSVSTLTNALGKLFGGIKRRRDEKKGTGSAPAPSPAPANPQKELQGKVNAMKGEQQNPNLVRNIAIGIGIAIVIGGVVWYFKR